MIDFRLLIHHTHILHCIYKEKIEKLSKSDRDSGMEGRGKISLVEWFFYSECLKNHAVKLGTTATDGCGERRQRQPTERRAGGATGEAAAVQSDDGEIGQQQKLQDEQTATAVIVALAPQNTVAPAVNVENLTAGEVVEDLDGRKARTTFNNEQKERMRVFAEDLEWKMVKNRIDEIDRFCNEIGVSRQNFKIWMHNHKNTSASSVLASMAHHV
ncbi:zinc-finger homeodomain protein 11-like [Telopea speciosissima]|uniref:zinc-finger homeodomain protein 11-like n=1 Tax=Telopea speciosissima TaxID=54955 RepID=UPI001CC37D9E|nr:zinc-finger homeodomain protein 11-like [Telopea speciosissima]